MIIYTTDSRRVAAVELPKGKPQMMITSDQVSEFCGDHYKDLWLSYTKKDKAIVKCWAWNLPTAKLERWINTHHGNPEDFSDLFKQLDWANLTIEEMMPDVKLDEDIRTRLDQMVAMMNDDDVGIADQILERLYKVESEGRSLKSIER